MAATVTVTIYYKNGTTKTLRVSEDSAIYYELAVLRHRCRPCRRQVLTPRMTKAAPLDPGRPATTLPRRPPREDP